MRRPLYINHQGAVVGKKGGRLVARHDGADVASAPMGLVSRVVAFGNVGFTTPALQALLVDEIPVVLLRCDGRVYGRVEPEGTRDAAVRHAQLAAQHSPAKLALARGFVSGRLRSARRLLTRRGANADEPLASELRRRAALVGTYERQVAEVDSVQALRGIEGTAARCYFGGLRRAVNGYGVPFNGRRRESPDVMNAMLNYGSAVLREQVRSAVIEVGLDPNLGFLHESYKARPALVFDLMEEWRAPLLERPVLSLIGLGVLNADSLESSTQPRLTREARRAFIERFHATLDAPRDADGRGSGASLRLKMVQQARLLRDGLNEGEYVPYVWH